MVVDRLTKFSYLFVSTTTFTVAQMAKLFLKKFSNCMGFLRALSVTYIADFLVHFGKNSSKWWGQIRQLAQAIIQKQMDKQRE